jgi:hypothetical protein
MSRAHGFTVAALLCALASTASAQDAVYRCGADGRSYSPQPCAGGRAVAVDDARSAEQAAQSRQASERDAQLADALQRRRVEAERAAARQGAAGIGTQRRDVAHKTCRKDASCPQGAASKRRGDKPKQLTTYRGEATTPTR